MFSSEIWAHILSFLNVNDMNNISVTCSLLHQISVLQNVRRKLQIPTILPANVVCTIFHSCSKLVELEIYTLYHYMFLDTNTFNLSRLRKLILHESNGLHVEYILHLCPKLQYLDLGNFGSHTYFCPKCVTGYFLVAELHNLKTIKCLGFHDEFVDEDEMKEEKHNNNNRGNEKKNEDKRERFLLKFYRFLWSKFFSHLNERYNEHLISFVYSSFLQRKDRSRCEKIFVKFLMGF